MSDIPEIDILSQLNAVDLSTVETSFPLLASGVVLTSIKSAKFDKDANKPDAKPFLAVEYSLTQAWKTVEHEGLTSHPVNPGDRGSQVTERIYVGKYTDKKTGDEKWYGLDRIAKLREAVFGKAPAGTQFVPEELIGHPIALRLLFEPAPKNKDTGEVYGPRTSVAAYIRQK